MRSLLIGVGALLVLAGCVPHPDEDSLPNASGAESFPPYGLHDGKEWLSLRESAVGVTAPTAGPLVRYPRTAYSQ